jgi:hypothetical protein
MTGSGTIPWRARTVAYSIAAAVLLVVGVVGVAYRLTRPEPGVFKAGEAGGVMFDDGDAPAAVAELERLESEGLAGTE